MNKKIKAAAAFIMLFAVLITGAAYAENKNQPSQKKYDWFFKPREDEKQPSINSEVNFLDKYDSRYVGDNDKKVIYLTFDVGYDNGYTGVILDVLKKENVPAAFFVTGALFSGGGALVKRMAEEGHLVCNHTNSHPNMANVTDFDVFSRELNSLADKYKSLTGQDMPKYYRPPMGCFTELSLKYADDLGYKTVFWSFAYVDWYNDKQPAHEYAKNKILTRTHPGEIALLHSTSKTNSEILGDIIKEWKSRGYTFGTLDELYSSP